MSEKTILLPCPFCGGPATIEECEARADSVRFSVGCTADEADCMGYQSLTTFARRSEAAAAWNNRPQSLVGVEREPFPTNWNNNPNSRRSASLAEQLSRESLEREARDIASAARDLSLVAEEQTEAKP